MNRKFKFKTLMGSRNLGFSLDCLASFLDNSADEIKLEIFDDGTITHEDEDRICSSLRNTTVLFAKDRESKVVGMLSSYPACLEYRNKYVHARKLFDVMLYRKEDLYFIDSDVYFVKPFSLPDFNELPTFLPDKQNAYAFTPLDFLAIGYPIYPRINSGMFYFPHAYFDLEYLEQVMPTMAAKRAIDHVWIEQTLWAFLAGKCQEVQYFDEHQICMSRADLNIDHNTLAVHLVTPYRYQYDRLRSFRARQAVASPSPIRLLNESQLLTRYEFAMERLSKKVEREFRRSLRRFGKETSPIN